MSNQWDNRFLGLAKHIAGWSKDPSTKVGCVITRGKFVESVGFNGFPQGMADDSRLLDKAEKNLFVLHAEENALLTAKTDLTGCTAYVWPLQPCIGCAAKLVQAGIKRIVANEPSERHKAKYQIEKAVALFDECGVKFDLIKLTECVDETKGS